MARPVKDHCDYFSHDNNMRDHRKIKALRTKIGISGYAIWCMLLEYMTGTAGNHFQYTDFEVELLAGDFGVTTDQIREVIDFCLKMKLLFNKDGQIHSETLHERLQPVYAKRVVKKGITDKQSRDNGKFVKINTDDTVVSVSETPQSKVKESKVKESKVKEIIVQETIEFKKPKKPEKPEKPEMLSAYGQEDTSAEKIVFRMQKIYDGGYENYKNLFKKNPITEDEFLNWKQFVDFCYEKEYFDIFKYNFINPRDFSKITQNGFFREKWEPVLKKIMSSGIKPEHNLFFRIPEYVGYVEDSKKTYIKEIGLPIGLEDARKNFKPTKWEQ